MRVAQTSPPAPLAASSSRARPALRARPVAPRAHLRRTEVRAPHRRRGRTDGQRQVSRREGGSRDGQRVSRLRCCSTPWRFRAAAPGRPGGGVPKLSDGRSSDSDKTERRSRSTCADPLAPGVVELVQGCAGAAELRGSGVAAAKSPTLSPVSEQPPSWRVAESVLKGRARYRSPRSRLRRRSRRGLRRPVPPSSYRRRPARHGVALRTRPIFPLVAARLLVPVASALGKAAPTVSARCELDEESSGRARSRRQAAFGCHDVPAAVAYCTLQPERSTEVEPPLNSSRSRLRKVAPLLPPRAVDLADDDARDGRVLLLPGVGLRPTRRRRGRFSACVCSDRSRERVAVLNRRSAAGPKVSVALTAHIRHTQDTSRRRSPGWGDPANAPCSDLVNSLVQGASCRSSVARGAAFTAVEVNDTGRRSIQAAARRNRRCS
jgi:hypothetical protein